MKCVSFTPPPHHVIDLPSTQNNCLWVALGHELGMPWDEVKRATIWELFHNIRQYEMYLDGNTLQAKFQHVHRLARDGEQGELACIVAVACHYRVNIDLIMDTEGMRIDVNSPHTLHLHYAHGHYSVYINKNLF